MEALLHYAWQHRLFLPEPMRTVDGLSLEIIDTGLHNDDAGPDFFNAKIKIGGQLWVGNVEIHERSSDWYRHGHETDENYNNVVLHVVRIADCTVETANGHALPQWEIAVPETLTAQFEALCTAPHYPPCRETLETIDDFARKAWLCALTVERLEEKTERILYWLRETAGDWERTFFITLARAFGFGKNSEAFQLWAATLDPQHMAKHRDNAFQIEALFFGQAGLLDAEATPAHQHDKHFQQLEKEYHFLRQKFVISPISSSEWRFLRLRPQNFPHVRLAQMAALYVSGHLSFDAVRECEELDKLRNKFVFNALPYWKTHYTFGKKEEKSANQIDISKSSSQIKNADSIELAPSCEPETPTSEKKTRRTAHHGEKRRDACLSRNSIDLLFINAVIPSLFAYARTHHDDERAARALEWLEQLRAESNATVRAWHEAGLTARHAADSQALLQLKQHYCDRKDCLRCRFGAYFMRAAHR